MALQAGQANVTITTDSSIHDQITHAANHGGVSVSRLLRSWLIAFWSPSVQVKSQTARKAKDELMVSIPRKWQQLAGIRKGSRLLVTYTEDALVVSKLPDSPAEK